MTRAERADPAALPATPPGCSAGRSDAQPWLIVRVGSCFTVPPQPVIDYLATLCKKFRGAWPAFEEAFETDLWRREAVERIFNPHHVIYILAGKPGPWLLEQHVPRASLHMVLGVLTDLRATARQKPTQAMRAAAEARLKQNRSLNQLASIIKLKARLGSLPEAVAAALLREVGRHYIQPAAPPARLRLTAPAIGLTVRPDKDPRRHEAWGRLVLHLCAYLRRTTRRRGVSLEQCYGMVARLLSLATGGICPNNSTWVRIRYHDARRVASKKDEAADAD